MVDALRRSASAADSSGGAVTLVMGDHMGFTAEEEAGGMPDVEDWEPLAKLIDMLPTPLGLEVPSRTTSVILCILHLQLRDGFQLRHLTGVQMTG